MNDLSIIIKLTIERMKIMIFVKKNDNLLIAAKIYGNTTRSLTILSSLELKQFLIFNY